MSEGIEFVCACCVTGIMLRIMCTPYNLILATILCILYPCLLLEKNWVQEVEPAWPETPWPAGTGSGFESGRDSEAQARSSEVSGFRRWPAVTVCSFHVSRSWTQAA